MHASGGLILSSHHTVVWLGYLVYCAFVCTVTDFSAAERDSGVKLSRLVQLSLLSGNRFSHFGELWVFGLWDGFPRNL